LIRIKKHTIAIVIVYYHCYCGQKNGDNNASKILIDFYKKNMDSSISNTSGNKLLEKIGIP
jgi:hypothetical protein